MLQVARTPTHDPKMQLLSKLKDAHKRVVAVGEAWQAYVAILGVPGIVIALLINFGKPFAWLTQLNWAADILLGLASACVLALVFSISAIAWRLLRPLPAVPQAPPPTASAAIPVYSAETLDLEALVQSLEERVDGLSRNAEISRTSFLAYVHWQMMREKAARIRAIEADLKKSIDSERIDWTSWNHEEREWQYALNDWADVGKLYVNNFLDDLGNINQEQYLSKNWDAKVNSITDADGLHKYKTFCLKCVNFNRLSTNAMSKAFRLVFDGPGAAS